MAARLSPTYRHARRNLWRLTYLPWRRFQEKYGPFVTRADIQPADLKLKNAIVIGGVSHSDGELVTAIREQVPRDFSKAKRYGATGGLVGASDGVMGERPSEQTIARETFDRMKATTNQLPPSDPAPVTIDTVIAAADALRSIVDEAPVVTGTGVDAGGAAATESSLEASSGFKVGETVEWTSSNKTKAGKIEQVIAAGMLPADYGFKLKDAVTPRDHESYIVRTGPTAKEVYWPRVSLLKGEATA